jgi:hypothetical protein
LGARTAFYDFASTGVETKREVFGLMEFVGYEYCPADVTNDFSTYFQSISSKSTHQCGPVFRLANIGRSRPGNDLLGISVREIFGSLLE